MRRAPLGLDRHHRRYWYGVAGQRSLLYVEDADGKWGALRTPEQLDALLAALDKRGVRESALHAALEKVACAFISCVRIASIACMHGVPGQCCWQQNANSSCLNGFDHCGCRCKAHWRRQ